ncbi:MAG: hypothetical protein VW683_00220 [Betaproteobacteria bacterium]|jgi:hypothetical protein
MTSFVLYTDKPSSFECEIEIEGASLKEADARLVLCTEDDDCKKTVLYEGAINKNGECNISIPKVKGLFNESDTGDMSLEVIVEGEAYFKPWEGTFKVNTSRKVKVTEVLGESTTQLQESKRPKMKVTLKEQKTNHQLRVETVSKFLENNNITPKTSLRKENKTVLYEAIERVFGTGVDKNPIIRDIITYMSGE